MALPLPDKINISRKTNVDLGHGSTREDYIVIATNIRAAVQPISLQDVVRAGRTINSKMFKCYLEPNADVLGDDHITYNGEEFNIISTPSFPAGYTKLLVEQII